MSDKSKLWYLENFSLIKDLPIEDKMHIEELTSMKSATKGQYIYFPDEPSTTVFFLKEGSIKIGSYSDDGKENIKAILKPGEMFGELSLVGEETRQDFAQALDDDVKICAMSMRDMEAMMEVNPRLSLKVTKLIGLRLRKTERKLNDLVFKDVKTRIIDFLKDIAKEDGVRIGDEIMIKHKLTHQDIANLTATTRQTVTTVLNELRDKDLIYMERKKFLIRNIDKL